jgi:hypothetical protein
VRLEQDEERRLQISDRHLINGLRPGQCREGACEMRSHGVAVHDALEHQTEQLLV